LEEVEASSAVRRNLKGMARETRLVESPFLPDEELGKGLTTLEYAP
jgi:hypothetical protein